MVALVNGTSNFARRGTAPRSIVAAFAAAVERRQERSRTRRRFHATRNALLKLDDHTLLDVTGLTRRQVWAMRGDRADLNQLGLI